MASFTAIAVCILCGLAEAAVRSPLTDIGHPAGLFPDCPGVTKNATISPRMIHQLQMVIHKWIDGQLQTKNIPILSVPKVLIRDKHIDLKKKKTAIYAPGFWDTSAMPINRAIGRAYAKRGYNVLVTETFSFLTYIYPKSVRLSMTIGRKIGELLVKLDQMGLEPENLELVGMSLGAQILSFASKHYYKETGKKPGRIVGLDPAGPCFRSLEPEMKFNANDGEKVVVIHTNIDGFGTAEPLGHVDFYANGGEYQPSDIPYIPCLIVCSHMKAMIYWWLAVENPRKFIGIKCDSVQDARYANCYQNNQLNNLGVETDFNKTGIFYLPTSNVFPYYRGKDGLKSENEIYTSMARNINNDNGFVV